MRIATRGSALALWQANHVASTLSARVADCAKVEIVKVETRGDRDLASPLHSIGGKGVFCKEVQAAVLDGRADLAVHSAKDLPTITPPGLHLGAFVSRGDVRDALVGTTLIELAPGARVATGSVRRRAQLARHRPDLEFCELRGNIATRLAKLAQGDFDAIVMAAVALDRLDLHDVLTGADVLPIETMVPQVGQAALAIECRSGDESARAALGAIDDAELSLTVGAERAFLAELGGDCSMPAAAHARLTESGETDLIGFLATEDLGRSHQLRLVGADGQRLGVEMAQTLRAALLGR